MQAMIKQLFSIGIFGALIIALIAFNLPIANNVLAQVAPAATARATRVRQPKSTVTPEPAATSQPQESDDAADVEADAELAPVAPGAMTSQILIFNPDPSGSATAQLDIYDSAGVVAYTTTEFISSNGAKLITLPNTLGSNFQGSAVISSDKNIQAIALAANKNKNSRDAYESASAPAPKLVIPFARHLMDNTQNSILAIYNATGANADVTITFYNADGSQAHQQTTSLVAHQPFYLNTNAIFPSATFTGSVTLDATQNIVAALQTRYVRDTAAVRALAMDELDTLVYLNQVERKSNAKGVAQNWSEIFARNNGANAADITIEFFSTAGASLGIHTASGVPANGSAQFLLNDAAFNFLGVGFIGWAKITASEPLGVSALSVSAKAKRLTGADGLPNAQLNSRYVCGDTARSATENSQLTLLNTEARNAKVIVRLFDPNTGAKLAQTRVKLAPHATTTVKFSDSLFAAVGTNFHGIAIVQTRGATPPKISASVSNPYGSNKLTGTTGYLCAPIP